METKNISNKSRRVLLFAGAALGGLLGALAGFVEAIFGTGDWAHRVPFVVGADGILGMGAGFVLASLVSFVPGSKRRDPSAALGILVGLLAAAPLAVGLGLLVNRVLLRGANFLSPTSLLLDGVVLVLSGLAGLGAARSTRRRLANRALPRLLNVWTAAVLLVAFATGVRLERLSPVHGKPDPARPPIILVSIDTLRPDHLSQGGDPRGTSPALDRLSRRGIQYADAITVSPGSAASHAALFTSRVPVSNGVYANFSILSDEVETIAERLRAMGYSTAGFLTNTFLGRRFGFDQGFDLYVESGIVERGRAASLAVNSRSLAVVQVLDRLRVRLQPGYEPSFEAALAFLREEREPLFLFVHLMDVHSPYVPAKPYGPRFGARPAGNPEAAAAHGRPVPKKNRFGWRPSEEAYAAEVRFMDAKIGRLVRVLEERGILDRGIVVLTSDHGENLLDHEPNFTHGSTLYDSTMRVLFALHGRGISPGQLSGSPVENIDVLPTLAAVASWNDSSSWEGLPRLGPTAAEFRASPAFTVGQINRDFGMRTPAEKIVVHETGAVDRFDLIADPGEQNPYELSGEEAVIQKARLAEWIRARATPLYTNAPRAVRPDELSPDVVDKLRTLGYIE